MYIKKYYQWSNPFTEELDNHLLFIFLHYRVWMFNTRRLLFDTQRFFEFLPFIRISWSGLFTFLLLWSWGNVRRVSGMVLVYITCTCVMSGHLPNQIWHLHRNAIFNLKLWPVSSFWNGIRTRNVLKRRKENHLMLMGCFIVSGVEIWHCALLSSRCSTGEVMGNSAFMHISGSRTDNTWSNSYWKSWIHLDAFSILYIAINITCIILCFVSSHI